MAETSAEHVDLQDLGGLMGDVARTLQHEHGNVDRTLEAITQAAVRAVPHVAECGISYVVRRTEVQARAATSQVPREVDALQERLQQGPCLSAIWDEETVRVADVATDERWPDFAREAPALGVASMLCFRLFVEGDSLGALNLYASVPHAFDAEAEAVGQVFASHAAIALAGAEHEENLRAGLDSRDLIGQAKGILMERFKVTGPAAFTMLVEVSNRTNRKLVDVAGELARTGTTPAVPPVPAPRPRAADEPRG